jgi:hypothetical protein
MAQKTGKTHKAIERLLARAREEFRGRWNHGQWAKQAIRGAIDG